MGNGKARVDESDLGKDGEGRGERWNVGGQVQQVSRIELRMVRVARARSTSRRLGRAARATSRTEAITVKNDESERGRVRRVGVSHVETTSPRITVGDDKLERSGSRG